MSIDLDDFKLVNDINGHVVGDKVLGDVAAQLHFLLDYKIRLRALVAMNALISKVDEIEHSSIVTDKLLSNIYPQLPVYGDISNLTLSIGMSAYADNALDALSLLKHADKAMYSVKAKGKRKKENKTLNIGLGIGQIIADSYLTMS